MLGKYIFLFIVWIGLTNSLDPQELFVGALVCFVVVRFFTKNEKLDLKEIAIKYFNFIPVFFIALVKANIEVAKIVLRPKIQINPGIVKLKTTLCDDFDKLLLANAITLTPGTITMELHEKNLYVHVLDVQSEDKQILQEQIISPFEEVIKS